ncbi:menaquinone biosynthesis protein [bacterium]|jgi:chorismate dehydratase|nr:menaquinone biosynthesis protein [bacterium]
MSLIRVGMINFTNGLIPDFDFPEKGFKKIYGIPYQLNELLRTGNLDLSPVSSMEYLLNPKLYKILPGICIASRSYAHTVGVFSDFAPEEWGGKRFLLTGSSLTSVYLFQVLCKKYLRCSIECVFQAPGEGDMEELFRSAGQYDGLLLIGDQVREFNRKNLLPYHDLCSLWHRFTGKSFVFALWLARADRCLSHLDFYSKIHSELVHSIESGLENLDAVFEKSQTSWDREEFLSYFQESMLYKLEKEELEGLKQFSLDLLECEFLKSSLEFDFLQPVAVEGNSPTGS